jgi:predicted transcriptional regulator
MDAIGPLQLRVMHFIWENGASTVHAVHDSLNKADGAPTLAYTTILTVMRNLAKRGILEQTPQGRSHVFSPKVSERDYKVDILRQVRDDLFGGSTEEMLATVNEAPELAAGHNVNAS